MQFSRPALVLTLAVSLWGCSDSVGGVGEELVEPVLDLKSDFSGDLPQLDAVSEVGSDVEPLEARVSVFAVFSDPHIHGDLDNGYSLNRAQMLAHMLTLDPAPEWVGVTGDLIDFVPEPPDTSPGSPLDTMKKLVEASPVPVHMVAGNHDYYTQWQPEFLLTTDRDARDALYRDFLGLEPYYAVDHFGTRMVFLNTMQGPLWDVSAGLSGSFGAEQLDWLSEELSDGTPAVLFMHHPPDLVKEPDDSLALAEVLEAQGQSVLAIFAGHLHLFARSEFAGVPLYLTASLQDGGPFHHVRVDPSAGKLEVLNEGDIDYGEVSLTSCDPSQQAAVKALPAFDGLVHHLAITGAQAEPAGFGTYLEEAIKAIPLVLQTVKADQSGLAISAQFTLAEYKGGPVGSLPPYLGAIENAPCLATDLLVDNPCFLANPIGFSIDLGATFGIPLKPGWQLRVDLTKLELQGVLSDDGGAHITQGLLNTTADLNPLVSDIKSIVISEYCAGLIASCQPGQEELPACPDQPQAAFFDQIPDSCDVIIVAFGARMFLGLIDTVPGGLATVTAEYFTFVPQYSESTMAGKADPALFTQPNCQQ
jgi:hypothetical protein